MKWKCVVYRVLLYLGRQKSDNPWVERERERERERGS